MFSNISCTQNEHPLPHEFTPLIPWKQNLFLPRKVFFFLEKILIRSDNNYLVNIVKVKSLSRVWLFATLWSIAHQAPLSTGFSRQEYWSGLPFPPQGIFPTQESNPGLPALAALQADALTSEPPGKPDFTLI